LQSIIALTPNKRTLRQLVLSWGVYSAYIKSTNDLDALIKMAHKAVHANPVHKLKSGDVFIISAGIPFGKSGTTNFILVQKVH
jgi:pyruvate kinase